MTHKHTAWVVYESVFGNTRDVAQAVARGLSETFEVEVLEVAQADPTLPGVRLVVVGGPTHAFSMSRPTIRSDAAEQARQRGTAPPSGERGLREWLDDLRERPGSVAAAAFDTAIEVERIPAGWASRSEASRLRDCGYKVVVEPEHFIVKDVDGPLMGGELERATAWGRHVAEAALARVAASSPEPSLQA